MDFFAMPVSVVNSSAYRSLRPAERDLLTRLYCMHSDCESFTIDYTSAEHGRDPNVVTRAKRLVRAGLLVEIGNKQERKPGPSRRIFRFAYPVAQVYEALGIQKRRAA